MELIIFVRQCIVEENFKFKMRVIICIFAVVAVIEASSEAVSWENFKTTFSKYYRNTVEEKQRYNTFLLNVLKIKEHNKKFENGQVSYRMGINKFTDLTPEEFMDKMTMSKYSMPKFVTKKVKIDFDGDLPTEINWKKKGVVSKVIDQLGCGACWAFSATGAVESQLAIKTGLLNFLSVQQLVDCAEDDCHGCNGGYNNKALEYLIQAGGIMLAKDYRYKASEGICRFNESLVAAQLDSYVALEENDESALKTAVATIGPVSVLIFASDNLQGYESGIFSENTCNKEFEDLNHAVLVVGYGSDNGTDYWLVKNSWGDSWGMDGYVKMSRNKDNQCGIATAAVYPILK